MAKTKALSSNSAGVSASKRKQTAGDDSSSDDDQELIDVDFEWFDPQEVDFHGLKLLLKQLLDADSDLFELSSLVNLILSQPYVGSTVKVPSDEEDTKTKDTDPFAFLTVLNMHTHRGDPAIAALTKYLVEKSQDIPSLAPDLQKLLAPDSKAQIGLILSERFINMPNEILPPMYRMLLEEIQTAISENEPYNFSHYLLLSKTYTEVASKLDSMVITEDAQPPSKKSKKLQKTAGAIKAETFYFHAEDEVFHRHAVGFGDFHYTKSRDEGSSDSKRAFNEMGIEPVGHIVLVEAKAFETAVKTVGEYFRQAG